MHRAIAHREDPGESLADLEVIAWDSETTGVALPARMGSLGDNLRHGLATVQRHGAVDIFYEGANRGLSMLAARESAAAWWLPDASRLSVSDRAAPLRAILNSWLQDRNAVVAKAAAVQFGDVGLILAGKRGAGKSTTALTCVEWGFSYLGDDLCAVSGDPATIYSIYNSATTESRALGRLAAYSPFVINKNSPQERTLVYLTEIEP
jgi:hypothetical protein